MGASLERLARLLGRLRIRPPTIASLGGRLSRPGDGAAPAAVGSPAVAGRQATQQPDALPCPRSLGTGSLGLVGVHARAATRRPFVVLYRSALHQGTAPGDQHHERQDCQTTPQESSQRHAVQSARWFDIGSARHRRHPHHATRRRSRPISLTPYLDPHERATENASPRTERGAPNPGVRTRARRWSGESGGSEGLASATTDNRPMSIDVYRAPAPGPSAPKPPGQPAIGGGLV